MIRPINKYITGRFVVKSMTTMVIVTFVAVLTLGGCGKQHPKGSQEISDTSGHDTPGEVHGDYYTCPMHPSVRSNKPGSCPICGMTLVKKSVQPAGSVSDLKVLGAVSLSPTQRTMANVSTVRAERRPLNMEINAVGVVDYAEPLRVKVTSRFAGRIEKLHVNFTGENVRKGQPLFEIHSPELYAGERELVLAVEAMKGPGANGDSNRSRMLDATRERLHLHFGVTHDQLVNIEESGQAQDTVTYYSPISGTVIQKQIQEGQYVAEGSVLYDLADLSRVWVYLDVYEKDVRFVELHHAVQITADTWPGETFTGTVTFIDPVVNSETRTVRVRSEFDNALGKLKPKMYVEARIHAPSSGALVIPTSAVMFTGTRNIVWVEVGENSFEPKEVQVGVTSGFLVEITAGLNEGETVVASGGYLLESESQLRAPVSGAGVHRHKN
jgi:Cu(I)/Ag(I) efflux system membrane fusion protein